MKLPFFTVATIAAVANAVSLLQSNLPQLDDDDVDMCDSILAAAQTSALVEEHMPGPMFRAPWGICRGLNLRREHPLVRIDRKYTLRGQNVEPYAPAIKLPLKADGTPMIKIDLDAATKAQKKRDQGVPDDLIKADLIKPLTIAFAKEVAKEGGEDAEKKDEGGADADKKVEGGADADKKNEGSADTDKKVEGDAGVEKKKE